MNLKCKYKFKKEILILLTIALILAYPKIDQYIEERKNFPFNLPFFKGGIVITSDKENCLEVNYYNPQLNLYLGNTLNDIIFTKTNNCSIIDLEFFSENITNFTYGSLDGYNNNFKAKLIYQNDSYARIILDIFNLNINEKAGFTIRTNNIFSHHTYYQIISPKALENRLFFSFDGNKYICDTECIQLFNTNIEQNLPIIHARVNDKKGNVRLKEVLWREGVLTLRFNPFNSRMVYWQKVFDTLFLGIIASIFYALIFEPLIRKLKLNK